MSGIPVRLSADLAGRAREAASIQDRSLTEQVEHWARLGLIVEATVLLSTVERLKALSYDEQLPLLLEAADTEGGRAKAAKRIRQRNPVRYGTTPSKPSKIIKVVSRRRR